MAFRKCLFVLKDLEVIQSFFGEDFFQSENTITIHYDRIKHLENVINKRFEKEDSNFVMEHVHRLSYPTINDILLGYNDYTKLIARKLNKEIADFRITGDSVYINPEEFSGLTKSLIHIFRNIADHGIELPDDRAEKNKPLQGNIHCHIEKKDRQFMVSIKDDGKGIDPVIIGKKALASGLLSQDELEKCSENHMINYIFRDNFSTKETVSMLSGRGVGLSSVKDQVIKLGGDIMVNSKIDCGTEFLLKLPLH
ncbi:ATP-binding protein [Eubacteriaceae bacterium ES3]|nr:ATP-binding protein [Eubacteriaceae bacterium ES3]